MIERTTWVSASRCCRASPKAHTLTQRLYRTVLHHTVLFCAVRSVPEATAERVALSARPAARGIWGTARDNAAHSRCSREREAKMAAGNAAVISLAIASTTTTCLLLLLSATQPSNAFGFMVNTTPAGGGTMMGEPSIQSASTSSKPALQRHFHAGIHGANRWDSRGRSRSTIAQTKHRGADGWISSPNCLAAASRTTGADVSYDYGSSQRVNGAEDPGLHEWIPGVGSRVRRKHLFWFMLMTCSCSSYPTVMVASVNLATQDRVPYCNSGDYDVYVRTYRSCAGITVSTG